jgi:hypothetical protein
LILAAAGSARAENEKLIISPGGLLECVARIRLQQKTGAHREAGHHGGYQFVLIGRKRPAKPPLASDLKPIAC